MTLIPLHVLCRACTHCHDCRDRDGGRAWRRSLAGTFCVTGEDFVCPDGLPWGFKGCGRCGNASHVLADCPIPPDHTPTPAQAVSGGCGCTPPVA